LFEEIEMPYDSEPSQKYADDRRVRHPFRIVALVAAVLGVAACSSAMSGDTGGSSTSANDAPETLESPIVGELETGMQEGEGTFDHTAFNELLSAHVDESAGTVDYAALAEERDKLDAYLGRIAEADLTDLSADAQLALLINAYNGYTLQLILENYPDIDSIQDLSDPWSTERFEVGGHTLSLDQIEHGLIRPIYRDPRIHFAVNCAAVDCPHLADEAYTGENLDQQLEAQTEAILTKEKFVRLEDDTLRFPRVMKWYRVDFVDDSFDGSAANIPSYLADYTRKEVRTFIAQHDGDPPAEPLEYDWSLNDVE
jgi:hypothetical protein